jgi:hypothetical protein
VESCLFILYLCHLDSSFTSLLKLFQLWRLNTFSDDCCVPLTCVRLFTGLLGFEHFPHFLAQQNAPNLPCLSSAWPGISHFSKKPASSFKCYQEQCEKLRSRPEVQSMLLDDISFSPFNRQNKEIYAYV